MLKADVSLTFLLCVDLGVDKEGEEGGDSFPGGITPCEIDCVLVVAESHGIVLPGVLGGMVELDSSRKGSG